MRNTIISLIIFLFGISTVMAQNKSKYKQYIGLKITDARFYTPNYIGGYGLNLEYDRQMKKEKHYWATGVGLNVGIFYSEREIDPLIESLLNENNVLLDFNMLLSIPITYIYKPKPWLILRTGINNEIPIEGHSYLSHDSNLKLDGIPLNRKYILEYHMGLGLEGGFKRMRFRIETFYNLAVFPREYYEIGYNLGAFYRF